MSIRSSVNHEKNILFPLFHQVALPCKFFKLQTIIQQLVGQGRIFFYFLQIELFFNIESIQFLLQTVSRQEVVAVEEYHPYKKCNRGKEVFIDEDTEDKFQDRQLELRITNE